MSEVPPNSFHALTRAAWRVWLNKNHAQPDGVWLITFKKATGKPRIDYDEAVEEALCFGWIDSKPAKLDEERSMLWFAPRKPGSRWSKINRERVARMIGEGKMAPAGLAKVETAKRDGLWNALDVVDALEIPADLSAAFAQHKRSRENFDAFPPSTKRGILEWILSAKRPETRAKRVAETARLAADNIRANQWRP